MSAVQQLELVYPTERLARRRDPVTSKAAANGDRASHRCRVLVAIAATAGMTYVEAAHYAGLEPHEAARRIADLTRLGLLEVVVYGGVAQVRDTPNGRSARVHRATDLGKREARNRH
jgi:predicted ArsR family transcriptional regulator